MGYYHDHLVAVAERWGKKYQESGMTVANFRKYMKKTMLEYGWSEHESNTLVEMALSKDAGESNLSPT